MAHMFKRTFGCPEVGFTVAFFYGLLNEGLRA